MNPVIDSDGLVVIDKFRGSELFNINFQFHECVFIFMELDKSGYKNNNGFACS